MTVPPARPSAAIGPIQVSGPGRDGPFGPPPGQNPASGSPAPGSHLGSTERRAFGRPSACSRNSAAIRVGGVLLRPDVCFEHQFSFQLVNCPWAFPWLLSRSVAVRQRAYLVLCRERVSCHKFPLGLGPSLPRLDGRYPRLRRLLRYYDLVRLLEGMLNGFWIFTFPRLPASHHRQRGPFQVS